MIDRSRLGRFHISEEFIDRNPDLVLRVMGRCIIVRAEHNFLARRFDYVAVSSDFPELEHGERTPSYEVVYSQKSDGGVDIAFARSKED